MKNKNLNNKVNRFFLYIRRIKNIIFCLYNCISYRKVRRCHGKAVGVKNNMLLLFAIYFLFCVTVSLNIVFPKMAFSFSGSLQSISTGAYHLCGVISDFKRQVYCWGYNADGELGNNNIANSFVPTKVTGINGNDFLTDVTEVSVGEFHSCAVINGGSVFCWGKNHFGQLGNGKSYDELIPTQVMGGEWQRSFGRCKPDFCGSLSYMCRYFHWKSLLLG